MILVVCVHATEKGTQALFGGDTFLGCSRQGFMLVSHLRHKFICPFLYGIVVATNIAW